MFSEDQLNALLKEMISKQQVEDTNHHQSKYEQGNNKSQFKITPSQALVVLGLLSGALQVTSVLVDRDQAVSLVLSGSLKRNEQTEVDKIMGQIGHLPFDEVVKAMVGRLK